MADSNSSACVQQSAPFRRLMAKLVMVMSNLFNELSEKKNAVENELNASFWKMEY